MTKETLDQIGKFIGEFMELTDAREQIRIEYEGEGDCPINYEDLISAIAESH